MGAAELVDDRSARVGAHARRSDEMRVAGFLHDFSGAGGMHHFHRLFFRRFDQLLVVVVKVEGDVRHANSELVASLRPG